VPLLYMPHHSFTTDCNNNREISHFLLSISPQINVSVLISVTTEMQLSLFTGSILVAAIGASKFNAPLTASSIAAITDRAERMLPEIRGAPKSGYMGNSYEEVIANVIHRFNAHYHASVELGGLTIAEKLDRLFPGRGYNLDTEDEATANLKDSDTLIVGEVVDELSKTQVSVGLTWEHSSTIQRVGTWSELTLKRICENRAMLD
jgi:hypothetical protein